MWSSASLKTILFKSLYSDSFLCISYAFWYNGWSKVNIGSAMYFFARPTIKSIVEIYVSSLAFKSVISINTTEDYPGWDPVYTICVKQFHSGLSDLKSQVQLQKSETVLSSSQKKCFRFWYLIDDNPILRSMNFVSILPIWIKESVDTTFFGTIILKFTLGVIVTMISIPWDVLSPLSVHIFW